MSFWLQFSIREALAVLAAFLATQQNLTPQQRADGEALAAAAQKFIGDFAV